MNYFPPTDNLYKFCAIAGLIIIGFSLYYPLFLFRTLSADVIDVSTDIGVLEAEQHYTEFRLQKLKKLTKDTIERQQGRNKPDPGKLEVTASDQEIESMVDEMERLLRDEKIATERVKGKNWRSQVLLVEFAFIGVVAIVSFGAGLKIARYGFRSWYRLVQKPLDEKLKEAESKEDTQQDAAGTADRPS